MKYLRCARYTIYGRRQNLYIPKGVPNVHNLGLLPSSGIIQNPDYPCKLEKYLAFANIDLISSKVEI